MRNFLLLAAFAFFLNSSKAQTTWSGDVAPILYAHCTNCHHSGGIAPFALMTYSDAFSHAVLINSDVTGGIMPPWPPDPNYSHFVHERELTAAEITTIQQWVSGGRLQGNITQAPAQPTYSNGSQLGTVDLSVVIPTYTVSGTGDVYRNFPIPTGLLQNKYITAVEVVPGNPAIVHHVLVFQDSTSTPATLDANDPGPGYTDAGGTGSAASQLIMGWAPGSIPYYTPVGTGFSLPANTNIVVQVHYPNGTQGMTDSTRINFKLTSVAQRNITVAPILNHFTDMTNGPISIAANTTHTYYEKYTMPGDATFLSVGPHMHLIGQSINAWANKPVSGDTIKLINIPKWSFHWQGIYPFQNAVRIPSGSVLQASAYYDNTSNNVNNPNSPPKKVTAGEATTDEMMMVFIAYMPYQNGDTNLIIDRRVLPQGATTFCTGQSVSLQTIEGNGYTYQWFRNGATINSATSSAYTATQGGNYSVQISLGPNNTYSDTVAVTVASAPVATVTPSGSTNLCPNATVNLSAATGAGYTYQWYSDTVPITGATTATYAANTAGNYSVLVYNGCYTQSTPVSLTSVSGPSATVTASSATTFCQGGSVTLSAPAGLTYHWSDGSTGQNVSTGQSGSYIVTVTNGNNCSAVSTATTVVANPLPNNSVTAGGATTFCTGQSVTLSAGASLTYAWSNNATTQSINVTQAGNYTVTVTNSNNCSAVSSPISVTVNPSPSATVTPNGATTFCQGGSVTLSAPAGSGLTYNWTGGSTNQTLSVSQGGSYTVTVTGSNNCSAVSTATAVVVNALPNNGVSAGGATTFCSGQSVTLSAGASLTYAWSNSATTQSITATQAGSYTVTVTNSNNCTAVSSPITVTVNPSPSATVTPNGATTFCQGGNVTLSAPSGSGLTYQWSGGSTNQSLSVSQGGSYTVTVTGNNSCSAVSTATTVVVNALPNAAVTAGGATTFCTGQSVTLSANSNLNYSWSNSSTAQSITVTQSGNYTVTLTNSNNCTAVSTPVSVTVNPLPSAAITAGGATSFCAGGSVTLSTAANNSYHWSNASTSQSINVNQGGTYSVTTTDVNTCSNSATVSVTVYALPDTSISTNKPTSICTGDSIAITAAAGLTYSWSNNSTARTIVVSTNGSYTVTLTDAHSCSAVSAPVVVTVSNNAVANISASGPTSFCNGGSVQLTASSGNTYLWSNGATTRSISADSSSSYIVTVDMGAGCVAVSNPTVVQVNPNPTSPTITPDGATSICAGEQLNLSAPAGFAYLWSTGDTVQQITVNQAGSYSVKVTNNHLCSASSTPLSVTVNPLPVVTLSGNPDSVCSAASPVVLTGGNPTGGTFSGTGVTAGSFSPSVAGVGVTSVTYTYMDNNGCTNTATESIGVVICTGINQITEQSVVIYPNPSNGNFEIRWNEPLAQSANVVIYNLEGKILYTGEMGINQSLSVSLDAVATACYILQLKTAGAVIYRKLIIEK